MNAFELLYLIVTKTNSASTEPYLVHELIVLRMNDPSLLELVS